MERIVKHKKTKFNDYLIKCRYSYPKKIEYLKEIKKL